MSTIRVFLVDDHHVVLEGLRRMLDQKEDIAVVGDAESGEEAVAKLQDMVAEVVLLDARLGGIDGIETLRQLKGSYPDLKVIFLTSYGDEFLSPAIEAGADGFFLKRANRDEIVKAIHEVVEGGKPVDSRVVPRLIDGMTKSKIHQRLSPSAREVQVLELAAGGLSNKQIADYLEITDQTVKNHITSILRKLDVNDRTHAITIALRKGWISNPVPVDWKVYT